jgi:hypothetical protein
LLFGGAPPSLDAAGDEERTLAVSGREDHPVGGLWWQPVLDGGRRSDWVWSRRDISGRQLECANFDRGMGDSRQNNVTEAALRPQ